MPKCSNYRLRVTDSQAESTVEINGTLILPFTTPLSNANVQHSGPYHKERSKVELLIILAGRGFCQPISF